MARAFIILNGAGVGFVIVKDLQIQVNLHPMPGRIWTRGPRFASLFHCLHTMKQKQQTMEISQGTALGAAHTRWKDATLMLLLMSRCLGKVHHTHP